MPAPLFKPGQSGNPSGKPPGTVNKITGEIKELLRAFCEENFDTVMNNFKKFEPWEQNEFWLKAASLIIPRRVSGDFEVKNIDQGAPDLSKLSDEELQEYKKLMLKTFGEPEPEPELPWKEQAQIANLNAHDPVNGMAIIPEVISSKLLEPEPKRRGALDVMG